MTSVENWAKLAEERVGVCLSLGLGKRKGRA